MGSRPHSTASSSIADSSANIPGLSPGARIHEFAGRSSRASRWVVRTLGVAYIVRVGTAAGSVIS